MLVFNSLSGTLTTTVLEYDAKWIDLNGYPTMFTLLKATEIILSSEGDMVTLRLDDFSSMIQ